jgi:hypothetical protein
MVPCEHGLQQRKCHTYNMKVVIWKISLNIYKDSLIVTNMKKPFLGTCLGNKNERKAIIMILGKSFH